MTQTLFTHTQGKSFAGMGRADDNVTGTIEKGTLTYEWKITVPPKTDTEIVQEFAEIFHSYILDNDVDFNAGPDQGPILSGERSPDGVLGHFINTRYRDNTAYQDLLRQIRPQLFTEYAPDEAKHIQTYNAGNNGKVSANRRFLGEIPHGMEKRYNHENILVQEGLNLHGVPIGLWRAPQEDKEKKNTWYALDGSGMALAGDRNIEELIKHPLVQRDLAARGLGVEKTGYQKYTLTLHGAEWASAPYIKELLIDDLFLKEIELAPNRRPSEAELDEKYPLQPEI